MAKGLKIVTIGGGSSYTPELIEGYIKRKDEMPIDEIVLVDIEAGQEKEGGTEELREEEDCILPYEIVEGETL